MFSPEAGTFAFFGMPENAEMVRHMLLLHPTMVKQLADHGFTRESFIQYIKDTCSIDWDKMTEAERESFKQKVSEGKIRGVRPEDCKSGLYREPFHSNEDVAIIVSGTGAGGCMVFQTPFGSTAVGAEDVINPRPFQNTLIKGATLTKYGR